MCAEWPISSTFPLLCRALMCHIGFPADFFFLSCKKSKIGVPEDDVILTSSRDFYREKGSKQMKKQGGGHNQKEVLWTACWPYTVYIRRQDGSPAQNHIQVCDFALLGLGSAWANQRVRQTLCLPGLPIIPKRGRTTVCLCKHGRSPFCQ